MDKEVSLQIILRQTDYSYKEAARFLEEYNNDYMKVIENYMGIKTEQKSAPILSINQEIFKQIRLHLDKASSDKSKTLL